MARVGQRLERVGESVALPDLLGGHGVERLPRHALAELGAHPLLEGLAAEHRRALRGPVGQIIALVEHRLVASLDGRLVAGHPLEDRRERFRLVDGHVARLAALLDFLRAHAERRDSEYDYTCSSRSEEHTSELQSLAYLVCRL